MLLLKLSEQVYGAFASPIFQTDLPNMEDLNDQICGVLLNKRLRANAEDEIDWSTQSDLHTQNIQVIDVASNMFGDAVAHMVSLQREMQIPNEDITIQGDVWGSLTRAGTVKSMLNYSPLNWRGIYFARCATKTTIEIAIPGGPDVTPGIGKYANVPKKVTLRAMTSTAIVFPAKLTHSIIAAPGDGLNITLEFAGTALLGEGIKK